MINHLALNTLLRNTVIRYTIFLSDHIIWQTNRFFLFAPLFVSMVFGVAFLDSNRHSV